MISFGRSWWAVLVLCMLLGGVCGYLVAKQTKPVYQASITLAVGDETSPSNLSLHDAQASDSLAGMYGALIRSQPILGNVTHQLHLGTSWRLLKDHVHVDVVQNAPIISVTVSASSPSRAIAIANAIAARTVAIGPGAAQSQKAEKARAFAASQAISLQKAIVSGQEQLSRLKPGIDPSEVKKLRSRVQLITLWQSNYITLAHLASSGGSANDLRALGSARGPGGRIRPHTKIDVILGAGVGALVALGLAQGAWTKKRREVEQPSRQSMPIERPADHMLWAGINGRVSSADPWLPELAEPSDRYRSLPDVAL
jgi:Chain length determinant protein